MEDGLKLNVTNSKFIAHGAGSTGAVIDMPGLDINFREVEMRGRDAGAQLISAGNVDFDNVTAEGALAGLLVGEPGLLEALRAARAEMSPDVFAKLSSEVSADSDENVFVKAIQKYAPKAFDAVVKAVSLGASAAKLYEFFCAPHH